MKSNIISSYHKKNTFKAHRQQMLLSKTPHTSQLAFLAKKNHQLDKMKTLCTLDSQNIVIEYTDKYKIQPKKTKTYKHQQSIQHEDDYDYDYNCRKRSTSKPVQPYNQQKINKKYSVKMKPLSTALLPYDTPKQHVSCKKYKTPKTNATSTCITFHGNNISNGAYKNKTIDVQPNRMQTQYCSKEVKDYPDYGSTSKRKHRSKDKNKNKSCFRRSCHTTHNESNFVYKSINIDDNDSHRTWRLKSKLKNQMIKDYRHKHYAQTRNTPFRILKIPANAKVNVKNIKFNFDQKYNVDPVIVVDKRKSSQNANEKVQIIKYLKNTSSSCSLSRTTKRQKLLQQQQAQQLFVLKSSNCRKMQLRYQTELQLKHVFTDKLTTQQRRNLSCIYRNYIDDGGNEKKRYANHVLSYHMEGERLSWDNKTHKMLLENILNNDNQILKHLIRELSKAIWTLSKSNLCHRNIKFTSILLSIEKDCSNKNIKVGKQVKLGRLYQCFDFKEKKNLLTKMSGISMYTPPEVINFMIFQEGSKSFDRKMLEFMYKYTESWRVGVWALGVMVLDMLDIQRQRQRMHYIEKQQQQHPKTDQSNLENILQSQKNIISSHQAQLKKIDNNSTLANLVKKMLSFNPFQRPSPQEILKQLS